MKITISFIAEKSGVSKSTVSRYLNGGYVSDEVREVIKNNIDKYQYVPNQFAQSLKAKHSMMVGVIIPRINSFASAQTLLGLESILKPAGYQVLISNTAQSIEAELTSILLFDKQKVDAIVLLATEITPAHQNIFKSLSAPIIVVGQSLKGYSNFVYNDHQAGFLMGEYCLKNNHKRWDYMGVSEKDYAVGVLRKQGVYLMASEDEAIQITQHVGDFTFETAEKLALDLLSDGQDHCVICATDTLALATMKAARRLNKKIPEEVQIVGCGDYDITTLTHPELSTVHFPYFETGQTIAKSIFDLMENPDQIISKVMDVYLIERGT